MQELAYMSSKENSIEGVREKYKSAIIDNYNEIILTLREKQKQGTLSRIDIENATRKFEDNESKRGEDTSMGIQARWGIISKKNFFGLKAVAFPGGEIKKDRRLFLRGTSGRFQMQKFGDDIFPNSINISDILQRNEEDIYTEIEEFYNMNNREMFEKYGVNAQFKHQQLLLADAMLLDSLLLDKYDQIDSIVCGDFGINITMKDETEIRAINDDMNLQKKGITIEKDKKIARVDFDVINMGDNQYSLTNINDLDVENVIYTGDEKLIKQLKQAMQEQFRSQQQVVENGEKSVEEINEPQETETESIEETTGAQKIIEFMKQNNLSSQDLALALTMTLAKTTDKENAKRQIINAVDKNKPIFGDIRNKRGE